ncbi:MAG: ABC transporter permease subunit [Anaerolineaceae bacterium]|nr:ABC transporter permease subunit [Anaerolineaceae bacterium]
MIENYKTRTKILHAFILVFVGIVCITWLIPLVMIVSASFTEESTLVNTGYQLIPPKFSLDAYKWLSNDPSVLINAYGVSIVVTAVGTVVGVLIMAMLAYVISRRDFKLGTVITFIVFFTMLFNGGLVPYYINMSRVLGVKNSLWALILPYLVTPFYVLLLRTYFSGLPRDLFDAARVDGAGELRIFFQIVVPLSTPALATVGLFTMLQYWNDMYQALLFIENSRLYPLQFTLYRLLVNTQMLNELTVQSGTPVPHLSVTMAMAVIAIGPVVFAFLFVQKYFVRGITLGSLKGD